MGGEAPREHRALHEKYGDIVRIGPNHVLISDVSSIPVIYSIGSKFQKSSFYNISDVSFNGRFMQTMFSARDSEIHRVLRTQVSQLYSMSNMRKYESYVDEATALFVDAMNDLQGQTIDLAEWVQWYAFDVIACISFQRRFGFLEQRKDVGGMMEGVGLVFPYMAAVGQIPWLHSWLLGNTTLVYLLKLLVPSFLDPLEDFVKITEDEIARYDKEKSSSSSSSSSKESSGRTDFLAQLREKEAKTGRIPYADVINHLSNNLLAGSDTTAISLRACFYYLMKNPLCYKKLQAEIDEADENGRLSDFVTHEECLKLPYLQAVLKEAMRKHPGVGFPMERIVPEGGLSIGDRFIPAGTIVGVSPPVVHHNRQIYGRDADDFRPERWLEASEEQLRAMDRNFLTFGHGSRTCIGKNISIMEMGKFVPQIVRHYDFAWASTSPTQQDWQARAQWLWRQWDMKVKMTPRRRDQ